MEETLKKLIFVYNADSGLLNALKDAVHKTVSPQTYECSLCAVTYGSVSMKPEWRTFVRSLPVETEFFHRDEFQAAFDSGDNEFPAVFGSDGKLLLSAEQLNHCENLDMLMQLVESILQ